MHPQNLPPQQQYPPQQHSPQQHAAQRSHPQQYSVQQHSFQQPPPQQHPPRSQKPTLPPTAGMGWRFFSLLLNVAFAFACAVYAVRASDDGEGGFETLQLIFTLWGVLIAASFANQVLFAWITQRSIGHLLLGLRITNVKTGRRVGFWRLSGRWFTGFVLIPFLPFMLENDLFGDVDFLSVRVVHRGSAAGG